MLEFNAAQAHLFDSVAPLSGSATVGLAQARGRVLARDLVASLDLPPADNSAMDGYAIRMADFTGPGCQLRVQQRSFAGEVPSALLPGCATRLFTGSLIPAGADAVVMQEDCSATAETLLINSAPRAGQHIRVRGEDMRAGSVVLAAGEVLGAAQIAILAAQGCAHAEVLPQVRVGILTTGDELIAPGAPLAPAAIYNSNAPMLQALVAELGCAPPQLSHAADDPAAIEAALAQLLADCDLVLSVGGVSVGDKDYLKPVVQAMGGALDFWRVRMKPGKPLALARLRGKPLVCLPGNPVSAFVVFSLLVAPMLRRMAGLAQCLPQARRGLLVLPEATSLAAGGRDDFLRVRVLPAASAAGLVGLKPYHQQSSGAISSLAWASALARLPAGVTGTTGLELDWYPL